MPVYVPRSQWNTRGNAPGGNNMGIVPRVVVHHTPDQDPKGNLSAAIHEVRRIQGWHMDSNGWADIGYTFLVSGDYIFEGRGFGKTGAHAPGANSSSIGIAFILDGRKREPTLTEWGSANFIAGLAVSRGYLTPSYSVGGHRDHTSTECPAALVYNNLHKLRSTAPSSGGGTPGSGDAELDATERGMLEAVFKAVGQIPDPKMRTAYEMIRHLNTHDFNTNFWPGMANWHQMYYKDLQARLDAINANFGIIRDALIIEIKKVGVVTEGDGPFVLDPEDVADRVIAKVRDKILASG